MITVPNNCKFLLGIFIGLLLNLSPPPAKACGGDMYWDFEFYRFFKPELIEIPGYMPFHYTFSLLYDYEWEQGDAGRQSNIEAWSRYFKGAYSQTDIEQLIYGTTVETLEKARKSKFQSTNKLLTALSEGKYPDVLDYLSLAMLCEPFNNDPSGWDEDRTLLPSPQHPLVTGLQKGYQQAGDEQLKMRYAFQLVRLLHYGGYFQESVQAYEEYAAPLKIEGLIEQWTRAQYAGALHGLKQLAPSAYHFSRVFDQCLSLRPQAWYSYDVPDEATWEAAMSMCRDAKEKANLYFMRAISPDAIAVEEIRNIQKTFPGSEKIDLLLVREINKLEEQILGGPEWDFQTARTSNVLPKQELALHALVRETRVLGQMHNRLTWDLADAYLDFLEGEPGIALRKLDRIHINELPEAQTELLDLAIRIAQMQHIDLDKADGISMDMQLLLHRLPDSQREELVLFHNEYLSSAYRRDGRPGMAMLAADRASYIEYEADIPLLEELMLFYKQPNKSFYEEKLQGDLSNNYSYDDLLEIKGTILFAQDQLPEAIAIFKQLPKEHRQTSRRFSIGPDPFEAKAKDIINCEPGCVVDKFTKLSLAQTIVNLKKKAETEPDMAGHYYHLLGNAYFTTSYFGACWTAKAYFRSSYLWGDLDENTDENVDVGTALDYYKLSIETSTNREIAALSCLMAAKAFAIDEYYPNLFPTKDQEYQPYYSKLMNDYGDTEVYEMAVEECTYFAFFVSR